MEFDSDQINSFLNDRLKIQSLKKIIFREVIWEEILGRIRKYICLQVVNEETLRSYKLLSFTCALAEQCFMNEYIYSFTSEETIAINKIVNRHGFKFLSIIVFIPLMSKALKSILV